MKAAGNIKGAARTTKLRMTNFVTEAVGASCSRCGSEEFKLGEARKPLADKLREAGWRVVSGELVCYDCIGVAVAERVVTGPHPRFRLEGFEYELLTVRLKSGGFHSGDARRTDGGGSRLVTISGEVLDAILVNWRG